MVAKILNFVNKYINVFILVWLIASFFYAVGIHKMLKTIDRSIDSAGIWSEYPKTLRSKPFVELVSEKLDSIENELQKLK